MSDCIRVLLVDDHRLFLEGLVSLLQADASIEPVGAVESAEEALKMVELTHPDVVLMDLDLPRADGIEATRLIKRVSPVTKVVIVSGLRSPEYLAHAMEAGASGYVPKTRAADELLEVVHRAADGEIVIPSDEILTVLSHIESSRQENSEVALILGRLTGREIEIIEQLAEGKSTADIASSLFISPLTVQSHVKSVLSKLEVHSKLEAVTFALRHGLIHISRSA